MVETTKHIYTEPQKDSIVIEEPRYIQLHHNLLEQAVKQKAIKELAFYLNVKSKTNSIIYDYNYKRLSNITGLSWQTCKKYTNKLIGMGFVVKHKDNLLFRNQFKINTAKKKFWHKLKEGTFRHTLNQIYSLLIVNNKKQQKFNVAKKYGSNKKLRLILTNRIESEVFFSIRSVAKLFAVSNTTAINILNKLENNKIIIRKEKLKFIKFISIKELQSFIKNCSDSYHYRYRRGCLFLHQGFTVGAVS